MHDKTVRENFTVGYGRVVHCGDVKVDLTGDHYEAKADCRAESSHVFYLSNGSVTCKGCARKS